MVPNKLILYQKKKNITKTIHPLYWSTTNTKLLEKYIFISVIEAYKADDADGMKLVKKVEDQGELE